MATSYEALIQAKKENVQLQLEAEYRERLQQAYDQVCSFVLDSDVRFCVVKFFTKAIFAGTLQSPRYLATV